MDKNKITIPSSEISPGEALEIEYRMTMAVLDNPVVDILGHIFGMSITRKQIIPSEEMLFQCISKAAKKGVAIEINSKYHPNPNVIIEICKENNALISLGSDAHCKNTIGNIVKKLNKIKGN